MINHWQKPLLIMLVCTFKISFMFNKKSHKVTKWAFLMLSWWNKISFCKETKCIVILLSVELWKNRAKWWESSPGKVKIIAFAPWRYRAQFFVPLSKKGGLVIFKQQDTHRAFFLSSQKTFKDRNHLKNAKISLISSSPYILFWFAVSTLVFSNYKLYLKAYRIVLFLVIFLTDTQGCIEKSILWKDLHFL